MFKKVVSISIIILLIFNINAFANDNKNNILSTLDSLIAKFDTMDWRENKWKIGQEMLTVFIKL